MANYYIQGSGDWPFGLDALSVSGQLFSSQTDSNLLVGYFGFPNAPIQKSYPFRVWEGLNTSLNIWYGRGTNNIAVLRSSLGPIPLDVAANSTVTAKITFNKNTKAYTVGGTPASQPGLLVNFVSNNSSIIGSSPNSQNLASHNLYYNGWHFEKDFTFNTTSTVNYKIVLGEQSFYGDNNQDGIATVNGNFIPLNVVAGDTYRFRAKIFTATSPTLSSTSFEYEVVCLTCPAQKQNQFISTPFDIYNKVITSPPFSLQATTNSNLPLFYSTSSPLFTLDTDGVVSLLGLTGSGIVSIFQPGNEQWFPAGKNVTVNIEGVSGSCIGKCLDTGSLYYTKDTFIKLYNETGSGIFIENKKIDKSRLPLITSNESWLEYGKEFSGYGLSGFHNQEAGVILKLDTSTRLGGQNRFHINYGVNDSRDIIGNYHKQLISIRPQQPRNSGYLAYFTNDRAWATYDVSTGMAIGGLTPNNVFSYAIDIVVSGVLSGRTVYTGNIDINTATGKAYVLNLEKNPILYTQNFNTLSVLTFNELQDFCAKNRKCEVAGTPEPEEICFTGDLRDSGAFQLFLSGVSAKARMTEIKTAEVNNSLVSISGEEIRYTNLIYSGYLLYNNWSSGDYIDWRFYNYNFPKLYSELHLGNYPPYLNTGFRLYYPNDFNSLDSLVDQLNAKVNILETYPVWYPYECLKNTESGIFVTGKLMEFYKNTGETGMLPISHFNNRIDFISLRSYPQIKDVSDMTYSISIFSQTRLPSQFFKGWNYLVPIDIQLEGFNKNTQLWETLDVRNNLSGDFAKIERIQRSMGSEGGGLEEEEEEEEGLPEPGEEPPGPSGCKDVILREQQRTVTFNQNPLCPPSVTFKEITVSIPKEECKKYTIDASGNLVQTNSNQELCGDGGAGGGGGEAAGEGPPGGAGGDSIGEYHIIRTGWNFNVNNLNLPGLNSSLQNSQDIGFDISKIYDKYRVSLSGFISYPDDLLLQKDSFYVQQVNLYTLDTGSLTEHKSMPLCTIGADYIIDVEGIFPIEISGIWNYRMIPEDSGIYKFFATPFVRKIEENEQLVIFNKVSGRIISESGTGFLTTSGLGVGNVFYTDNSRYFYNPLTQSVYFSETISGIVTGRGIISGNAIAVKTEVINQELLFGGRLASSPVQYHEIVSNGTFDSTIENVEYVKYDVLGYYPITGIVSGNTISGRLNATGRLVFTGTPVGDRFAYYPEPTGFINSEAIISINYNNINNFDFISINGNDLTFNSDNTSFLPPIYFNNNNVFINTINNDPGLFLVTATTGDNDTIILNSNISGSSGNINILFNSTGVEIINYLSGTDFYPRLYKIVRERILDIDEFGVSTFTSQRVNRDPIMTGNISELLLGTGFYSNNSGSGNITGNVSTFQGIRNFSGIWGLSTGFSLTNQINFRENNYIGISGLYTNNQFFEREFPFVINTTIGYFNQLNAASNSNIDVAELVIKNINNTGISGFNFRITGVI
jgi:hypothetical protein